MARRRVKTEQQQRLVRALLAAGFKRSEFSARTSMTRRRDRSSGLRYTEYGDAYGWFRTREATGRAAESADVIAADPSGLTVTILRRENGDVFHVIVGTTWRDRGYIVENKIGDEQASVRRVRVAEAS